MIISVPYCEQLMSGMAMILAMTIRVTLRVACLLPCPGIDMAFPVAGHLRGRVRLVSEARIRSQGPAGVGVLGVDFRSVLLKIQRTHALAWH